MKVLDLFCGMGGWSKPFVEDGDEVIGIDIIDYGYPGKLILQDIRTVTGKDFEGFDLIIGSPPCMAFSNARYRSIWIHKMKPNPVEGFELIDEFWRIVKEACPTFYAMENIKALAKYYSLAPQWEFNISKGGKRYLWTNIPIPIITPQFIFEHKIRDIPGWAKTRPLRSLIPYPIARYIRDLVKNELESKTK